MEQKKIRDEDALQSLWDQKFKHIVVESKWRPSNSTDGLKEGIGGKDEMETHFLLQVDTLSFEAVFCEQLHQFIKKLAKIKIELK